MNGILPTAGLLELPGFKGTIQIRYDLTKGIIDLDAKGMAYAQLVQVLLAATQGAVNNWAMAEAGIVRPKAQEGKTIDGSEEQGKASDSKDDDHDR